MPKNAFELRIQDAGAGDLLESLLGVCERARRGGALFAWTNASGAKSLLWSKSFGKLIEHGEFDLIVGLDSITDEAAIKVLITAADRWEGLSVRAFMHDQRVLFHPKMAWFHTDDGLTLIIGSGNLTMGGLQKNWEAFTVVNLADADADAAHAVEEIEGWLVSNMALLRSIRDPRVLERAKENSGNERSLMRAVQPSEVDADELPVALPTSAVLIAQIPRSGDRWGQVNFDAENYEQFFGALRGTQRQILLYHVRNDGTLDEVEVRPTVEVRSQNYRIELRAARGREYPEDGRPIGTFMRLGSGEFLYMLLLPTDLDYSTVSKFLQARWTGRDDRMLRYRTTVTELATVWPDSPLWDAVAPEL
jgi:hypothetical protein